MKRLSLGILLLCVLLVPSAFGQATRTWVSGVGDDVNPCSRTAPCKTFAGAISKTAAGGEISVLDPGGFGAVNITKSMLIDGTGTLASILFSGTNGVIVNVAGGHVTLRNLSLNGGGTGLKGVRIIAAAHVTIEDCEISNFTQNGISDERTTAGTLTVLNTTIRNGVGASSNGIVAETVGVNTRNVLRADRVNVWAMGGIGLLVANDARAVVTNSSFHRNGTDGVRAAQNVAAGTAEASLDNCSVASNAVNGVRTTGTGAAVRLSNTSIHDNRTNGTSIGAGSAIVTYGNNRINGNVGSDGVGMSPNAEQ